MPRTASHHLFGPVGCPTSCPLNKVIVRHFGVFSPNEESHDKVRPFRLFQESTPARRPQRRDDEEADENSNVSEITNPTSPNEEMTETRRQIVSCGVG